MNYPYKKGYWETKDHKVIKIVNMETSHIKNTINYLKKHRDFYDEYYNLGYCDDDDFESFDYEDNSELVDRKIEELEAELNRRNEA